MRRNPFIAGAIVAVTLVAFAVSIVLPRGREVALVEQQVVSADARNSELASQLAVLKSTPSTDVATEVAAVRRQIPSTPALPELLRSLTDASRAAGVALGSVTFGVGSAASVTSVSVLPVTISATGGYFDLARFVFELEHLDRLAKVASISILEGEAGALALTVTAEVYTTDPSFGPGSDPAPGSEVGA